MPIVTLITDLGKDTHVVAKAKVKLLSAVPTVNIIDISHSVTPFLTEEAVYLAKSCVNDFPKDTIHLISVDVDIKKYERVLACRYKDQIFITSDNGFLAMLTNNQDCEYFAVPFDFSTKSTFSALKNVLAPVAINVIEKGLEVVGVPVETILEKTVETPVIFENGLRGKVIYINNFGNSVTNISRAIFDNERVGRRFRIVLNRFDNILELSNSYSNVGVGDNLCFFNDDGLLEVAINKGKASELLGLGKDKRVSIEFFAERTTSETKDDGLFKQ